MTLLGILHAEDVFTAQANGNKEDLTTVISNMPTGDLTVLDADYDFRLAVTGKAKGKR